jgi:hypothetical protein
MCQGPEGSINEIAAVPGLGRVWDSPGSDFELSRPYPSKKVHS